MRRLLLIVLLLCPLASMAEMRCGTLAHSIIRFDSKHMFMPASYEGVSYWGGEGWKNRAKGCLDRLVSVTFTVNWPSLEVSREKTFFNSSLPDRIAITYKPNHSKDSVQSLTQILRRGLRDKLSEPLLEISTIRQRARFNAQLGLYQLTMPQQSPYYFLEGYWNEGRDSGITTVITCDRYTKQQATSTCELLSADLAHGVWIQIYFYIDRLQDWNVMQSRASDFLQQLVVKEIEK